SLVHAELTAAEADHHVAVAREPTSVNALEADGTQAGEQLVGGAWRRVKRKGQLRDIVSLGEDRRQRAKHFTGPGMKFCSSFDQRSVETSMSVSVMRMLFTDDGRPPRDR